MGAGDLELLDLTYVVSSDDEPRLKVGDLATGDGVGQDCAYLCTDGFISFPNPPDSTGAAQGIAWTPGNDRFIIACQDGRYNGKAGTVAPGDRAIVSKSDAALKLTQASNKIQLLALAQGLAVTVDATGNSVSAMTPKGGLSCGATGAQFLYASTPAIGQVLLLPAAVVLSFNDGTSLCSVTLGPGGTVAIVAPGGVTINGTPVV
jgi:hypothetical protein